MSILGVILNRTGIKKLNPAIFLHIPKTAGTTIVELAQRHYGGTKVCSHGNFVGKSPADLQGIPFVSGHFGYEFARELMPNRYSFTFLRDPAERILSSYYFCLTRDPNEYPEYRLAQENSLDRYLELVLESRQSGVWNCQARLLAHSWKSVPDFSEDELVALAIRHLSEFSYVGFTETFDQDMPVILGALGIAGVNSFIKSNVTLNKAGRHELPSSTRKLLEKASELDRLVYEHAWASRAAR